VDLRLANQTKGAEVGECELILKISSIQSTPGNSRPQAPITRPFASLQLAQGPSLDIAELLARDFEYPADFWKGTGTSSSQAIAQFDDFALAPG
jgi:hypothetical protein